MAQWLYSLCMLKFTLAETEIPLGNRDHHKHLESQLKVHYYRKEHSVT